MLTCCLADGGDQRDATQAAAVGEVPTRTFALPIPLFAPDSAWNQTVAGASALPESDQQVLVTYRILLGDTSDLSPGTDSPRWPFPDVNYDHYAIPIFRAGAEMASVGLYDYEGNAWWPGPKFPDAPAEPGGPVTVPAPVGVVRPAGPQGIDADGHLVLYEAATSTAYDLWQASTALSDGESLGGGYAGTTIFAAGAVDYFDVAGPGTNPDGVSSARAVGTPLLAGLILPEDVESGAISHALAFAIPGPRNLSDDPYEPLPSDYVYPAVTTEGDFYSTHPHALAAGQRIRLKGTLVDEDCEPIDEGELAPITRMFLAALRSHGAYLVDNAGGFTFYAEDVHSAHLDMSDAEVAALIGEASLPPGRTGWQAAMERLNLELEGIPFACGEGTEQPRRATVTVANVEVVEPATRPAGGTVRVYLPVVRLAGWVGGGTPPFELVYALRITYRTTATGSRQRNAVMPNMGRMPTTLASRPLSAGPANMPTP